MANLKDIVATLAILSAGSLALTGCGDKKDTTNPTDAAGEGGDVAAPAEGEGSCGAEKDGEGSCGAEKDGEGSCGAEKDGEGSCGAEPAAEDAPAEGEEAAAE